ncbi:hypothetical protein [Catellatospora citrea]|uniref:Uncharacterized protein n=1 Tax=Catellatospora citrea TaxID=53366 RepID=A0A8J3P314_9ACTN|nr:hypothetical protein [Catellatospora citrea]RKE09561.1 hypothetical protein C8E86_4451 [Catellatospora citrea]GIG02133.1 hypothetical protein Cci01nite_72260 [Catellatospora citrea]
MELRRGSHWVFLAAAALAPLYLLLAWWEDNWGDRLPRLVQAVFWLIVAVAAARVRLRPFRFRIDELGLAIRTRAYEIAPAWSEIDMVILEQPPPVVKSVGVYRPDARLLLVPAPGVDFGVPLTARSPLDHRPCLPVVDFGLVADKPQTVAAMLTLFGGDRFVDDRVWLREALTPPDFTTRPFGYDRAHIDDVIRRGRDMLTATAWRARRDMAVELLAPHPLAPGGYDPVQVDRFTSRLSASIASLPGVPPPTG